MAMFNGRIEGKRMLTLKCHENRPSGLLLCQKKKSHTLISSKILKLHTQTLIQQSTNKDGKTIREPKCLDFSASGLTYGEKPLSGEGQFGPASPLASSASFVSTSERGGLSLFIRGLLLAHFVAVGHCAALLICCLDLIGFGLIKGQWKCQQNTEQSHSSWVGCAAEGGKADQRKRTLFWEINQKIFFYFLWIQEQCFYYSLRLFIVIFKMP